MPTNSKNECIRIGGASGSASDHRLAMSEFAHHYPHDRVDVIIADFMSEFNMGLSAGRTAALAAATAARKHSGAADSKPIPPELKARPGYEPSFLEALEPALKDIARYGIKVVANAGVTDTKGLYRVVEGMVKKKGLSLKIAWVSGDECIDEVKQSLASGRSKFKNIYTGETLSTWNYDPLYAQCYLGGMGIAEALEQGADIVLCGRVSDASPIIGAATWYHGWRRDELDKLANAFVAGHLIECSTYVTGGNYTGFKSLEHQGDGWSKMGYPIAEIGADGAVVITKQAWTTGGTVSVDTCTAQLLYEIQGPWYFNSDVTAVLTNISFEHLSTDRVALRGVGSSPPPPTTKVGITAEGGFQAELWWFLVGLDIEEKARMMEAQIRRTLAPFSKDYTTLQFQTLGSYAPNPRNQNSATVPFRILVQARTAEALAVPRFLRPVLDNMMQAYPGATSQLDVRLAFPKPIYEYYVTLLPQEDVKHQIHLPWKSKTGKTTIDIPPPPSTRVYPERQPSESTTSSSRTKQDFGPTTRGPLGWVVHGRSGDKGSDANCGFWVRHEDEFTWLRGLLSIDTIKDLLGDELHAASSSLEGGKRKTEIEIERFELPNLRAVHFLFRNLLDRGVGVTTSVDVLGKNVAEFLRARWVDIPVLFLDRGKL